MDPKVGDIVKVGKVWNGWLDLALNSVDRQARVEKVLERGFELSLLAEASIPNTDYQLPAGHQFFASQLENE